MQIKINRENYQPVTKKQGVKIVHSFSTLFPSLSILFPFFFQLCPCFFYSCSSLFPPSGVPWAYWQPKSRPLGATYIMMLILVPIPNNSVLPGQKIVSCLLFTLLFAGTSLYAQQLTGYQRRILRQIINRWLMACGSNGKLLTILQ